MRHCIAGLSISPAAPDRSFTAPADLTIAEFVDRFEKLPHSTVILSDDQGKPLGVVQTSDVLRRIDSPSPVERRRWLNLPIESVMSIRLDSVEYNSLAASNLRLDETASCLTMTTVLYQDSIVALASETDLFISWKSIQAALRNSQQDAVTGLPNRSAFEPQLAAEFERAARSRDSISVIIIDVDHFKEVNDLHGHATGDFVLKSIATAVRQSLRSYDFVARFGGDEFAVICCGCRPGDIKSPVQRIQKKVRQLNLSLNSDSAIPSVSIGACVLHDHSLSVAPSELLAKADDCLYEAKNSGRDRFVIRELGVSAVSHHLVRGPRRLSRKLSLQSN